MLTNKKESACNQNVVLVANGYAYNRDYKTGFSCYFKFILGSKRRAVEKPTSVNPCQFLTEVLNDILTLL